MAMLAYVCSVHFLYALAISAVINCHSKKKKREELPFLKQIHHHRRENAFPLYHLLF